MSSSLHLPQWKSSRIQSPLSKDTVLRICQDYQNKSQHTTRNIQIIELASMDRSALLLFTATALIFIPVAVDAPLAQELKTDHTTAILTQVLERYPPTANIHYKTRHFHHCSHAYSMGRRDSGVYLVKPDQKEPFEVYCDMETAGGWTVVQRRVDGSTDFNKSWRDYVNGFGNITDKKSSEFWLGLEKMYRLTSCAKTSELLIKLRDFNNKEVFAHYRTFALGPKETQYKLLIGGYNGTAGDTLSHVAGLSFSTRDNDNDGSLSRVNCAELYGGGWWFRDSACGVSNLNGRYLAGEHFEGAKQGIYWHYFRGEDYSLKFSEMKIKGEDY